MAFTHLHVHSEYSLLDGLTKIKKLVTRTKELGMDSVALTDHGIMYGSVEFYKAAIAEGIKPLIGMETYIVNKDHKIKDPQNKDNFHLVLIAKNFDGYKNLMKIATIASVEGYYYRPRVDKETLKQYSQHLIALTACPAGEVGQLLISGQYPKAKEAAGWYWEVFGKGNYFLEIQRHEYKNYIPQIKEAKIKDHLQKAQEEEDILVEGMVKLSRDTGIPLVATNDAHYLKLDDAFAQDVLVCISTGKKVTELDRLRYVDSPTFDLKSEGEMRSLFADLPEAIDNTNLIPKQVDIQIELGKWCFPNIDIPEGKTPADYLRERVWERLPEIYPKATAEIKDRLQYELDVIIQKGYPSYFLMEAEMVNWCAQNGIITNTRGSAAGSTVSYVLGITTVDPIKYGLPFERFLNPMRPKAPDIDLDIADDRRDELIAHIVDLYGSDKVAQICTFGRMLARAAVRDVGRALGFPYATPDKIAKLIPMGSQGFPMTLNKALEMTPELAELYKSDKDAKQILDVAQVIEGNARHASVHAAGVVVSPTAMTDFTPLQHEPKGEKIITQYEMHACEEVGLVKFDILGIRNLSILGAAVDIIEKTHDLKIDLRKIPIDDKKTFEMLARGDTMGTFQLGGAGMTKWLKELKPNRIEDIMVMIALFRPGPLANIPEYIARKNGKSKVTYLHPKMANFLEKSYGILVYQEDVLFTALELAGYTWETVDKLRTAIGKKIPEEMAKQHEIFVEGCQNVSGLTKVEAEKIWDLFVPFQGYGFNKAHAASYGMVSYQTAYLKAHWPVEYMTALLTAEASYTDKVTEAIAECNRIKIKILPPDINVSEVGFTIEPDENSLDKKAIRFGLDAIKNVGNAAIEIILKARKEGPFKTMTDFCQRVDGQKVNKKVLESLIKVGAMDRFGKRASMLAGLDELRAKCSEKAKKSAEGQGQLFEMTEVEKPNMEDNFPEMEEFGKKELLSLEKELLGFYLSDHPLNSILPILNSYNFRKIGEISEIHKGQKVKIGGIIADMRVVFTKKNNQEMAFAKIEDGSGAIEVVIFPKIFAQSKQHWVKDGPVIIKGKIELREDQQSIIIDEVFSIEDRQALGSLREVNEIEIEIPANTNSSKLMELNRLLRENQGNQKVVLVFVNGEIRKRMPLSYGIEYTSELVEKIAKIII